MPAWPGTPVTSGGTPSPHVRANGDEDIHRVTELVLSVAVPPPAEQLDSFTVRLRRFIDVRAPRIRVTAADLPIGNPRRVAAEKAAEEAEYRVRYVQPGSGLQSAFAYCKALARSAQELIGHQQKLALAASANRAQGVSHGRPPAARRQ
ncbi:DUF6415 family natural product biosynthesis protein [Streptomyces triculaminicus]|uniref:DUF6415 family natural product biosynthesis protein n=1 Tax=Streptomyces triculaminicus TaxID=2816232 RepID=UPI0037B1342F